MAQAVSLYALMEQVRRDWTLLVVECGSDHLTAASVVKFPLRLNVDRLVSPTGEETVLILIILIIIISLLYIIRCKGIHLQSLQQVVLNMAEVKSAQHLKP